MDNDAKTAAAYYLQTLCRMYGGKEAPAAAIDELCDLARSETFEVGAVLAQEGEAADRAFFVIDGALRASIRVGHGDAATERTVNEILPGEVAGEAAVFMTGARRSATLTAVKKTIALVLRRELFQTSARNPALVALEEHLLRLLAVRIESVDDQITRAWRDDGHEGYGLRDRLAHVLAARRAEPR